ncbi:N-acyl homoserine lactonase family protein [Bradyrhizobium sp. ISRA464]|uniref:N-acyl homoserine lactonase family protein n=1 Tax=Bradyrhizobium sp. ISRA464 TaxID=2866200 RepID=UPI00247A1B72|nr:N-acyl homoserine lactonase family protein [Bradyrhizobium sp. ISRA464]WGS25333.1 N-acyl homoserine lactonase family protein [Bradyrhizobium sp. ISRA464]
MLPRSTQRPRFYGAAAPGTAQLPQSWYKPSVQKMNLKSGGRHAATLCKSPGLVDRRTVFDRRGDGGGSPERDEAVRVQLGALNLDKSIIQNGASGKVQIPVGFFLIRHPKGDVLFDCGNNDKIITNPDYWGPFVKALDPGRSPDIAIDNQLSKINVKPSDIKYVVLGHFHVDHAGNIGKFLDSTFVYQRDEIRNAFWPAPGYATFFITDDFAMLRNSVGGPMPSKYKTIELDGDLDLFGDNSIYIHRTVSHTPGSQIMVVRLPKTGTVVLTSDAVYLQENLDKNILPSVGSVYDPVGMLDAYAWVKRVHDAEGGDILFAHDPDVYKAHKHSPEFYE